MKKNKIALLALSLIIALSLVACRSMDRNLGDNRDGRLSTQTRINDNRWDSGTDIRDNRDFGFDNNLNDGMGLDGNNNLNNDMGFGGNNLNNDLDFGGDNNLNDGMTRPNPNLSTNIGNTNNNSTSLSRKIKDLPEVDDANVIVNNDTAIVGVTLRGSTQGTMTNALRNKIERIVKDSNKGIKNVSITTEPELFKRIRTISRDVDLGNPVRGFADEVKDIIRSITNSTRR